MIVNFLVLEWRIPKGIIHSTIRVEIWKNLDKLGFTIKSTLNKLEIVNSFIPLTQLTQGLKKSVFSLWKPV